ncbi:MAG: hypothetical protein PUH84_05060 [Firmicutes bacterium]|nr:hypothetical protein [Bacillota bacterium]MDY5335682.1 hypothetical protein [Bacilli bacterium]
MMEENKKGANTLYAVIGIATLVVAIIGATFAYFSATAKNAEIQGTTAEAGGLTIEAKQITDNTNNNIIPLNLITNQTLKPESTDQFVDSEDQFEKAMTNKCKDSLGNNICTVYKVVVANQSKTATIQVQGKLNLSSPTKNMYWTLIDATTKEEQVGGDEPATTVTRLDTATAKADFTKVKQGIDGNMTYDPAKTVEIGEEPNKTTINAAKSVSLTGTEGSNSTATFYVLVWLEETGAEQQDDDASKVDAVKSYTGNITFDAVDAQGHKSGVTATFLS